MADNRKKQVPLRLSTKLYNAIAAWAEDDFRSVNGQIEYLLTECVRQRKKNGKYAPAELDVPPELDLEELEYFYRAGNQTLPCAVLYMKHVSSIIKKDSW